MIYRFSIHIKYRFVNVFLWLTKISYNFILFLSEKGNPMNKMMSKNNPKVAGIICEYNPFHNGHAYHIEMTKKVCGADYVIAVMSGDFTQRGDPAITDKYSRARMALLNGCDVVIELPVRYATSSAEGFAFGAVNVLAATGIVDRICFGCESDPSIITDLEKAAKLIDDESEEFKNTLTDHIKDGYSYPAAREQALSDAGINLSYTPNNILALEYVRACRRTGIKPYSIERKGGSYNDANITQDSFASAAAIRKIITESKIPDDLLSKYVPANVLESDPHLMAHPMKKEHFSLIMLSLLLANKSNLENFLDVSDDLANRIENNLSSYKTWDSFVDLIKTKQYTYTRINRALLHCMLGIKKAAFNDYLAPYIRILGFNKHASGLMKLIRDNASVPVITKPADIKNTESILDAGTLSHTFISEDFHAEEIYRQTRNNVYNLDILPQNEMIIVSL